MTAAWTEEQIRSLAPDVSSISAARPLAPRWRDAGIHDEALWGRCHGSGSRPYQTVIDLSGPAYKCSCPSRKFPCKHALSLLLLWSAGRVPSADSVPAYVAEWLATRAAKVSTPKTANPATIEQRRARVTSGLTELDTWLTDQVRTGLAQSARSYEAFESIAARMVDAQAPGVASTLRSLFNVVVTKSQWPEILLREYSRLHLLVRAHQSLDSLPAPTQAAVRAHVGYPIKADAVRLEPAVRDVWMVLGRKTTEENQLHTRRTWLYGRRNRRWALLVEHSYGIPNFTGEVPIPGIEVEGDVHYYPGSASLRVQWGAKHGPFQPFTTIPASGGIADALAAHAGALGADPWLRSWPAVLADVIPVAGEPCWELVDGSGNALPLTPGAQAWQLLAISGGHRVTVVGDWTADGFEPVSVLVAGRVFDAAPDRVSVQAPTRSDFAELVSVALVGTARRSPDHAHLAPEVSRVVSSDGDPATRLLEAAALQYLYLRGGELPAAADIPTPAPDDDRFLLPPVPARRLAELLATRSVFLPEWLAAAARFDYQLPAALCVQALSIASVDAKVREPLLRMAGPRGQWLAAQNPEWSELRVDGEITEDSWLFGSADERRKWFAELRRNDPAAARNALAAGWAKESGPLKAQLLEVLADGLSPEDETLLETALDDRRADVRATAVRLLSRLPESSFAGRMAGYRRRWIEVDGEGNLTVTMTDSEPRDFAGADRLRQVIATTPLTAWPVVRTVADHVRQSLLDGWIDATVAQRDSSWATTLFGPHRTVELFAVMTPDEQIRRVLATDVKMLLPLLKALPHPWPEPVAEHVFGLFARRARSTVRFFEAPERALMPETAVHAPVSFARRFDELARYLTEPIWQQNMQRIAHSLTERATMLAEFDLPQEHS